MSEIHQIGSAVAWDEFGAGVGQVAHVLSPSRSAIGDVPCEINDASEDNPAYLLQQADGALVLKFHSELRAAGAQRPCALQTASR